MRMSVSILVQFSMLIILGMLWFYQRSQVYFAENDGSKLELKLVKMQIEEKEFQLKVAQIENVKAKQEVLALLEKEKVLDDNLLAKAHIKSGLRLPASYKPIDFTSFRVEEMRTLFREKNYFEVISLGEKILKSEKEFLAKPEVLFFVSESYYLNKQYEKAIEKINQLVSLFPEHIMTGYALLRLAHISEKSDQLNEAESIYKIIVNNFKDKALTSEAKKLLTKLGE